MMFQLIINNLIDCCLEMNQSCIFNLFNQTWFMSILKDNEDSQKEQYSLVKEEILLSFVIIILYKSNKHQQNRFFQ